MFAAGSLRSHGWRNVNRAAHHPAGSRFSLTFITDNEIERIQKAQTLPENTDTEVAVREETVNGNQLYLLYVKTRFDAAYRSFEMIEEVLEYGND